MSAYSVGALFLEDKMKKLAAELEAQGVPVPKFTFAKHSVKKEMKKEQQDEN
jgi:hypothetical protein